MNNVMNAEVSQIHFASTSTYDYLLTNQSPGIDSAIILNQDYLGYLLKPNKEYQHPMNWKTRFDDQHPDISAHELQQLTKSKNILNNDLGAYYDASTRTIVLLNTSGNENHSKLELKIYNAEGKKVISKKVDRTNELSLTGLHSGIYFFTISGLQKLLSSSFVLTD